MSRDTRPNKIVKVNNSYVIDLKHIASVYYDGSNTHIVFKGGNKIIKIPTTKAQFDNLKNEYIYYIKSRPLNKQIIQARKNRKHIMLS